MDKNGRVCSVCLRAPCAMFVVCVCVCVCLARPTRYRAQLVALAELNGIGLCPRRPPPPGAGDGCGCGGRCEDGRCSAPFIPEEVRRERSVGAGTTEVALRASRAEAVVVFLTPSERHEMRRGVRPAPTDRGAALVVARVGRVLAPVGDFEG